MILPFPALFLMVFAPGWLIVRRRLPADAAATERWALYAGVGIAAVSLGSAALYVLPLREIGVPVRIVPLVTALVIALVAHRVDRGRSTPSLAPATAADRAVAALAVVAFAVFFVGLDHASRFDYCLFMGVEELYSPTPAPPPPGAPPAPLFGIPAHSRVGNPLAFAIPHSLHGPVGRRLTNGLIAGLLVLTMTALGRRVTGRTAPALIATGALLLTADVFGSVVVNQNLYAAALGALFLLVLQPAWRGRWALRGLAAAALFASRHVAGVAMGALLYVAVREGCREGGAAGGVRAGLRHAAAFAVATLPVWAVIGWESTRGELNMTSAFLNAPLHDELVRVPFVPLPLWAGWPVYGIAQWGLLAAAAIVVGAGLLWRGGRDDGTRWTWLLYAAPLYAALGVQANWVEPEKMTIGLLFAPIAVTALAAAIARVTQARRPRHLLRSAGVGAAALAAIIGLRALLLAVDVPEDPRVRGELPNLRAEGALLGFEANRWATWRPLPLPDSGGLLSSLPDKLRDAWRSLQSPTAGRPAVYGHDLWSARWTMHALLSENDRPRVLRAIAAAAAPASVPGAQSALLDLRENLPLASRPLRALPASGAPVAAPVLALAAPGDCALTPSQFRIRPWDQPARVLTCLSPANELWLWVAPPSQPIDPEHSDYGLVEPVFPRYLSREDIAALPLHEEVVIEIPEGVTRAHLIEIVYLNPDRVYRRAAVRTANGEWDAGRAHFWRHN